MKNILIATLVLFTGVANGAIITQIPTDVGCTVQGTGAGNCSIFFQSNTIPCTNSTILSFDPNSLLGKEIYSMALTALAASKQLEANVICDGAGNGTIDWIRVKR